MGLSCAAYYRPLIDPAVRDAELIAALSKAVEDRPSRGFWKCCAIGLSMQLAQQGDESRQQFALASGRQNIYLWASQNNLIVPGGADGKGALTDLWLHTTVTDLLTGPPSDGAMPYMRLGGSAMQLEPELVSTKSPFVAVNANDAVAMPQAGSVLKGSGIPVVVNKPLGLGSTGRSTPSSLNEQLAMEQAIANPGAGRPLPVPMTDPRWPAADGWVKTAQNINGIEIHYVRNSITGAIDDFKFK